MPLCSLWRHNQFLCGPYPFNGDERTVTGYGHFRVIADLGRRPLVEVLLLDPKCCVVY